MVPPAQDMFGDHYLDWLGGQGWVDGQQFLIDHISYDLYWARVSTPYILLDYSRIINDDVIGPRAIRGWIIPQRFLDVPCLSDIPGVPSAGLYHDTENRRNRLKLVLISLSTMAFGAATTTTLFISSTLITPPPPKPPTQTSFPQQHFSLLNLETPRRNVLLLYLLSLFPSALTQPSPATAFEIGFSGPKDWLREQKKKASQFVLSPIDASRESIRSVYLQLSNDSGYPNKDLSEVQGLIRSAARDCVPQERNSFVSFQASTGVEVCTFRLIVNNAASLLDDKDSRKLEAEAMLSDLIRSFTSLEGVASDADLQMASNRSDQSIRN
ncbi:hypothetical protein GIB67_042758 [Kingdonia uniflora]|uniref:Uncharacterized protein n=1 Tax=Kingdonia uniflora TaxID=39325 RepID=A0A7J7L0Z4_9MAGN|nr:hypothetical protein GIB67_042758 [Kingdonia uniflora]